MEIPVTRADAGLVDRIAASKDPPVMPEELLAEALRLIINMWRRDIGENGLASRNGDQPL
jgi:hypothetical protein